MTATSVEGLVTKRSGHSVDETVERLTGILRASGVKVFALIDHSGEAAKVGMAMPRSKLLIFGNPRAGTPLMIASPTVAIDLPLKVLVWEDSAGAVWVSYNASVYLETRHHLPHELVRNIEVVGSLVGGAAE